MTTTSKTQVTTAPTTHLYDEAHLSSLGTTAAKVRYLATLYVSPEGVVNRGAIAKILDIRYQWVRNVLITPLKKA